VLRVPDVARQVRLLHGPGYDATLRRLGSTVATVSWRREYCRHAPGYSRAVAVLGFKTAEPVDLFHNGAAGLRAQYYLSTGLGEAANLMAVTALGQVALSALSTQPVRGLSIYWAQDSLEDVNNPKIWIYQGRWLRSPVPTTRQLFVPRWARATSLTPDQRRRRGYAELAPQWENRLVIKGGYRSRGGAPLTTLKPNRSRDVHADGYT
jgi:hypothetical protein